MLQVTPRPSSSGPGVGHRPCPRDPAVFYLPAYAPELNPDEYLNGDLKLGVAAKVPTRTKPALAKAARSHLRMLQRRPARVRRFFQHPRIKYAA